MSRPKVEAGQVWSDGYNNITITRATPDECFRHEKDGREVHFGYLKDGFPKGWNTFWQCIKEVPKLPKNSNLLEFFKSVPDGYCPCNIHKSVCDYHK